MTTPFLAAAARVGSQLCARAFWHEGRCNWVGRSSDEMPPGAPNLTPTVTALGTDLYSGTAGVALFLGQLHALTGDAAARAAAEGALARALAAAPGPEAAPTLGLYSGELGLAWACARLGALLGEQAWVDRGVALALACARPDERSRACDVVSGLAGAALGLLATRRLARTAGQRDALLAAALGLGDELCARAIREPEAWSWSTSDMLGSHCGAYPLCGLSHGNSGAGAALIELGAAAGRPDLCEAGLLAFAYERRWFSAEQDNWPDLRDWVCPDPREPTARAYGVTWCHGSPGIALARLRALELLPERRGELLPEIEACLRSTRQALARDWTLRADATPCHGAAGLVEVFVAAAQTLGEAALHAEAAALATQMIAAQGDASAWPSGLPSLGPSPTLMLGDAGVGYLLLRVHDPAATPSVLLIR